MKRIAHQLLVALALAALPLLAFGHHILGIPHYAYDESYPQAPVITYSVAAGPYVIKTTGYPGKPSPGELAEIHAYIYRLDDETQVFAGPIEASLERDGFFGPQVMWGPSSTRFEENLHKISPKFGEEGHYRVRLEMELEGQPYEIDFPMVVGDPRGMTTLLLSWAGAIVLLIVVVRAIKIKTDRRRGSVATV